MQSGWECIQCLHQPATYNSLANGSHTFQVAATDLANNTDPSPASHNWTIDATAPETTITANPPASTTSTSATFQFTSTEPGSTFACSLDGANFTSCTSPTTYNSLVTGGHNFRVVASTRLATWIDIGELQLDLLQDTDTPPDTAITSNPSTLTNKRTQPLFSHRQSPEHVRL